MAMHRPDRLVGVGHALAQRADELAVQLGHGIAHGVGDVDRASRLRRSPPRARGTGSPVRSGSRPRARTRRRRTGCARSAPPAGPARSTCSGVMRSFFSMCSARGGDEGVDARPRRALQGLGSARDVAVVGPRQRAHRRVRIASAIARTASKSPLLDAAKPASITSTCRRSSWRAMRSFSSASSRRRAIARRRARWCRR